MNDPSEEGCKKRKRGPKTYEFHSFGERGYPILPLGPFRDNIRLFVQQCAEPESYRVQGMPIWCTVLVHDNRTLVLPLYTIEENVTTSLNPFCDYCRCAGWSNHFVSKRKYHMIIPMDDDWNKPLDDGVLDHSSHLLHGLIHCDGFAHLLCINGLEGGSKHLCGRELMDLWDRICITLRTRKITVEDVSKKHSMELRLLHGVAYGHPWFGKWGYKFCHGSIGVKEHIYERALEIISSLELEKIIQDFSDMDQCEELKKIVRYYRYLSETQLATIKDLLRFMLTIKACFPTQRNSLFPAAKPAEWNDILRLPAPAAPVPGIDFYNNVNFIYEHVLLGYPESKLVELATQTVLGTQFFVKECSFTDDKEQFLTLFCQILPSLTDKEIEFKRELPPGEMVVMPLNATVGELKQEAEKALRNTYCITEQFVVTEIKGLEHSEDIEVLSEAVQSGTEVVVRGSGIDLHTPLRYQGGSDCWMVRCECGATDDGERMVACDVCEVWQHTHCYGMVGADDFPHLLIPIMNSKDCGTEVMDRFFERSMKLHPQEGRVEGSTNTVLWSSPDLLVVGADTRTSITWPILEGQTEPRVTIYSEDQSKVSIFGGVFATMVGDVKGCEDIWRKMEDYISTHPSSLSIYEIASAGYDYVCGLRKGRSDMFIGAIQNQLAEVYFLENVNEKTTYHSKRLVQLEGSCFAIGSGFQYAEPELQKWDKASVNNGVKCTVLGLLLAALRCRYTGGHFHVHSWDASAKVFKIAYSNGIIDAYKRMFNDLDEYNQNGIFLLYSNNVHDVDIRSIPDVIHFGHDLAKTTSGFMIRILLFANTKKRDQFMAGSRWCGRLPIQYYQRAKLKSRYMHFQQMTYKMVKNEIIFVSKPSLKFLESLETMSVTKSESFPVNVLKW